MLFTVEKLHQRLTLIRSVMWRTVVPLDGTLYLPTSPSPVSRPSQVRDLAWQPLPRGTTWGVPWQTVWLRQPLTIPPELRGQPVALNLRWRAEGSQWSSDLIESQVFLDDTPFAGLDGEHRLALLPADLHAAGTEIFVQAHTAQPQPFGGLELVVQDEPTARFAHTLRVGLETLEQLDQDSLAYQRLLQRLNNAYNLLDLREGPSEFPGGSSHGMSGQHPQVAQRFYDSVQTALDYLDQQGLVGVEGGTRPQIVVTGHAHIDVAWLWPLWRTRQKTAHTFSTVLRLMEQYPEFHFTASTPQLYAFIQADYPELYAEIKQRVAEGRWEAIGAMWLEADCNVPSGEALVRQFLFGMRFLAEEFGVRDRVLWLPDVFGYSAALPQIMRGCGVDTFMTTKISWSQFNRAPFDTFWWQGIDGSQVLTHFVTTPSPPSRQYTYNGAMRPGDVAGAWREYRQKDLNDELLYLMGYGDGGGGPSVEQLETARRLADMPGMPQVRYDSARSYFDRLNQRLADEPRLPTWVGELYLEYHRGTYTSQSRIKQSNRRAEQLLHDAEFLDAWATYSGSASQRARINDAWRLVLLNQFHDILPGSSIKEVYQDATQHYAEIMRIGHEVSAAALARLVAEQPAGVLAINTLGWQRRDPLFVPQDAAAETMPAELDTQSVVTLDGRPGLLVGGLEVPGYGLLPVTQSTPVELVAPLRITAEQLENQFFRIELDAQGEIAALYDKRQGYDVLLPGQRANQLIAFEDRPLNYDAWDIEIYYEQKAYPVQDVQTIAVVEQGPLRGGVEIVRRFLSSTIRQRILIYRDLPRIDFQTEVDWHDHQILLKAAFPLNINTTRATHEIQFGAVERPTHRNTSWDVARFETCAQRWVDLSEGGYGVALLNDSKYGYDVHGSTVRLTLLKSAIWPDAQADQGVQQFTYALLPHAGDWREGEVVRRAAELNQPLLAVRAAGQPSPERQPQPGRSFVRCDAPHVMLDTIKTAEDGDGIIVRLYEAHNQRGPVALHFAQPIAAVETCNLLEEPVDAPGVLDEDRHTLRCDMRPFEIRTLRVRFDT